MKIMNVHEDKGNRMSMGEKFIQGLGERIIKVGIDGRSCRFGHFYEPELPVELLEECLSENISG